MAGRLLSLLPGVRATKEQVAAFAALWEQHNERELATIRPGDDVFVAVGDSLSQGIGASSIEATWVMTLAERYRSAAQPVRLLNLSTSGGKISDVLDDQLPRLASLDVNAAVVTCTVGSNDLIGSARFGSAVERMRSLLAELPDAAVMATIPDRGSVVAKAFNRRLRTAAAQQSVRLADVAPLAYRGRKTYARDWFHPNDHGYTAWLTAFSESLGV